MNILGEYVFDIAVVFMGVGETLHLNNIFLTTSFLPAFAIFRKKAVNQTYANTISSILRLPTLFACSFVLPGLQEMHVIFIIPKSYIQRSGGRLNPAQSPRKL
jgi:hypothetical protein